MGWITEKPNRYTIFLKPIPNTEPTFIKTDQKTENRHRRKIPTPTHLWFQVGVFGDGESNCMALFPVRTNLRWRPSPSWKNFKWPYLRNRSGRPIHFMFGSRVGFVGTADRMALFSVPTNPRWRPSPRKNFKWPYLRNGSYDLFI